MQQPLRWQLQGQQELHRPHNLPQQPFKQTKVIIMCHHPHVAVYGRCTTLFWLINQGTLFSGQDSQHMLFSGQDSQRTYKIPSLMIDPAGLYYPMHFVSLPWYWAHSCKPCIPVVKCFSVYVNQCEHILLIWPVPSWRTLLNLINSDWLGRCESFTYGKYFIHICINNIEYSDWIATRHKDEVHPPFTGSAVIYGVTGATDDVSEPNTNTQCKAI